MAPTGIYHHHADFNEFMKHFFLHLFCIRAVLPTQPDSAYDPATKARSGKKIKTN